jgi:hypothetical protein
MFAVETSEDGAELMSVTELSIEEFIDATWAGELNPVPTRIRPLNVTFVGDVNVAPPIQP